MYNPKIFTDVSETQLLKVELKSTQAGKAGKIIFCKEKHWLKAEPIFVQLLIVVGSTTLFNEAQLIKTLFIVVGFESDGKVTESNEGQLLNACEKSVAPGDEVGIIITFKEVHWLHIAK